MRHGEDVDRVYEPSADIERELAALRAVLEQMQTHLAEEHATVVSLRAALDGSRAELRGVHGSLSWRVTRPLRIEFPAPSTTSPAAAMLAHLFYTYCQMVIDQQSYLPSGGYDRYLRVLR